MPTRRKFLTDVSKSFGIMSLSINGINLFSSCGNSEADSEQRIRQQKAQNKLGIALVGLGNYSTNELAPALQETKECFLAGIVTGHPDKADKWKRKYGIPDKNIYSYDTYDSIRDNPEIDIIY